jgi:tellurite resistance protein TerC
MTTEPLGDWILFNLFILVLLALDLGLMHRKAREITVRQSLAWSAVWIALALAFDVYIYFWLGSEKALQFLTGYLIEKSLSVDNIFVFLFIFTYFGVRRAYQYKILFWGILGALVMRIVFIFAGIALIEKFHWVTYLLGALLIVSGIKMVGRKDAGVHPDRNPVLRLFGRLLPVAEEYEGDRFFVRRAGRLFATPLLVVLVVVETTDVVFAADSIPAVLAISLDPFIVYTSNVFAILGLRMLYFAMAGIMPKFRCLDVGIALILVFVGVKMLLADVVRIPVGIALAVVAAILAAAVVLSSVRGPGGGEGEDGA